MATNSLDKRLYEEEGLREDWKIVVAMNFDGREDTVEQLKKLIEPLEDEALKMLEAHSDEEDLIPDLNI